MTFVNAAGTAMLFLFGMHFAALYSGLAEAHPLVWGFGFGVVIPLFVSWIVLLIGLWRRDSARARPRNCHTQPRTDLPTAGAAGNPAAIRKFFKREGEFLLAELGAPDARTLLRRAIYIWLYGSTGIVLAT